ncbi:N-acetylglucosaminyltransferase [Komagataeibacter rhaeticus]|uniref:N-acetylglucosaminyltransferase n=4 Tax=Komagataeibacter rhaeticus TaxID=215221 RepID=A0A858JJ76_9PROT|nr:discoidin domain-containing protein [Komagataeibacter rhaeticus]ATU73049.1 N-acetylglucosaminyltransferase [Komagataeibacter xylinus]MBL7239002.1 discoidin domain-containing protein [Komagataeibacter rhaeticus]PYD54270.1 N-acetylglucosaminyltransferase [Komagataeibacter rhaeticus]QIP36981.1 N-acetylglucosaminyltransferase [Komagataeibacter rhaeticus]QOC48135.1 discoidin domain-containing protein [Komagataeibacter rhaeticus]
MGRTCFPHPTQYMGTVMRKVYDCFSFFDELDILDIRLRELNDIVDYFVICESSLTFNGDPKPKLFLENAGRYKRYQDRIIHFSVDFFPAGSDHWSRDTYQKEQIRKAIAHVRPDDLIIFSDVDEIPRRAALQKALEFDGVTQFSMNMYQYYLNMVYRHDWDAAYALPKKYLDALDVEKKGGNDSLSVARYNMPAIARTAGIAHNVIHDAGWHFTHMGGVERLLKKFSSYAHAHDFWPNLMKDEKRLRQQIDIGIRIWSADELARYVPVDESYPIFVRENIEYFKNRGYIKDIYEAHAALQDLFIDLKREYAFSTLGTERKLSRLGYLNPLEYVDFAHLDAVRLDYLGLARPQGTLVSGGKRATQSSRSIWSHGAQPEDDASRALVGQPTGRFSFHTDAEIDPWWRVDLEDIHEIAEIRIFNRVIPHTEFHEYERRLDNVQISISEDDVNYTCIYFHNQEAAIGGIDGRPLIFHPKKGLGARYVKIHITGAQMLHLDKVYIYRR